ncbi:MAG: hypothetical protein K2W84_02855 [Burkholderiales bacterium]|nr:hypothetical protein [Burkholderiales bacterium]
MLGRPFGVPGDAGFQRRVLRALLSLFEHGRGPLLEDFPEDAPAGAADAEGFACPVSFAASNALDQGLAAALREEVRQLASWHGLALRRRGRTTVGVFGPTVDAAVAHIAACLDSIDAAVPGMSAGAAVKRASDDIRAYYFEAAGAQPGNLSPAAIERWFWSDTAAARALFAIRDLCLSSSDASLKPLGKMSLIPRAFADKPPR